MTWRSICVKKGKIAIFMKAENKAIIGKLLPVIDCHTSAGEHYKKCS